jgi:hypothetical protein
MKDATYVILNWEQSWDDPHEYFLVTIDGTIVTYNILTEEVVEYEMDKAVH